MSERGSTISKLLCGLLAGGLLVVVVVLMLSTTAPTVKAWVKPCDFLTGGGWIVPFGAKATFGVGGGCKNGSGTNGIPYWGHLEYLDHGYNGIVTNGQGLNVHATSITYYAPDGENGGTDQQPTGIRHICGAAKTNLPFPNDNVYFHVRAKDAGEPGVNDQFDIRLCPGSNQACGPAYLYATTASCFPHYLGSSACSSPGTGGGGNIQLHDDNPSTTEVFGGSCSQW